SVPLAVSLPAISSIGVAAAIDTFAETLASPGDVPRPVNAMSRVPPPAIVPATLQTTAPPPAGAPVQPCAAAESNANAALPVTSIARRALEAAVSGARFAI